MSQETGNNYTVKISGIQDNEVFDESNAYFSIIPFSVPSEVIITEIMQNPASVSDANGEWFEICNLTNYSLNLNGWTISDYDNDSHTITADIVLPPLGYAVLGNNGDYATNGGVNIDYEYDDLNLANGSDELILISPEVLFQIR